MFQLQLLFHPRLSVKIQHATCKRLSLIALWDQGNLGILGKARALWWLWMVRNHLRTLRSCTKPISGIQSVGSPKMTSSVCWYFMAFFIVFCWYLLMFQLLLSMISSAILIAKSWFTTTDHLEHNEATPTSASHVSVGSAVAKSAW